ncbi:DUF4192 domain-containing protein [Actinacidiphila oryziradicis]|uniref:DUF4192 domain-containing protein n=1 Tax=Actinacidiphila oryziradicis TaxID=2571141 RepID=UPI0023EF8DF1|nr:DUF4192 domain-containing protein [Actinacidiphila oryziradicis]
MTQHIEPPRPSDDPKVTLRSPAELADALPFLMGFYPSHSIVLVALHGEHSRFGGRLRLGIPDDPAEWPEAAAQLADCLIRGSEQRGDRPDSIVVFLCPERAEGESPARAMERVRPLAQSLRTACGALDVPVVEALCVTGGRWWSYCCPGTGCCPPEGAEVSDSGDSVMAAAAAYAGIQVRGSLREMEARLAPPTGPGATAQVRALDTAAAELVPRMLDGADCESVRRTTLTLVEEALRRFRAAPPDDDGAGADRIDDALLGDEEAASIVLGLQDRITRDRAAEWMEPPHTEPALRLWRALARRCVKPYEDHAAAPLTLAGWIAWSSGDETAARVAFGRALDLDPDYTFARLLHAAVNNGLDPEPLRHCLRQERRQRVAKAVTARRGPAGSAGRGPGRRSPGARRARTRR